MEVKEDNLTGKLIETYESLVELQKEKKRILEKHEIDKLGSIDERILSLYNRATIIADKRESVKPNDEEKKKIKALYQEISKLENLNQALIKYSLNLINNIFEGIMKIASVKTTEYTRDGKSTKTDELNLSSIVEEA